jgi:amidase
MTSLSESPGFPVPDTIGAWVPHGHFVLPPTGHGTLDGTTFAAKDLYDVAGHRTGAGNPTWLATHDAASATSPLIETLLGAGATLLGKTVTDELAYSIQGDNFHYGTPINTRSPARVPGGSSSGSAAAVAARLCDFALGTDTGGSTRVPASYCGLWGLRTTHGLLSLANAAALSPKFDTATWLAHDAALFERVGSVLAPHTGATVFTQAWILEDACAQADEAFQEPIRRVSGALEGLAPRPVRASEEDLDDWRGVYMTASAYDAWQTQGAWIEQQRPVFGPAVAARWKAASQVSAAAAAQAFGRQAEWRARMLARLGTGGVAILPSASSIAPARDASADAVDRVRANTFRITCIAGLAGLPQVSLPFLTPDGLAVGVSLLGPPGSDLALIRLAVAVGAQLGCLGTGGDTVQAASMA